MSDASITPVTRASRSSATPSRLRQRNAATHLAARLAARWQRVEDRLARLSDWLNPILVKETRQALRSWQFTLTFILLLVACWVVTIGGVAVIGPSIYYAAGGGEMLRAYYLILALPLLVVVPFAAFRSLAAEREDNTYDLLSITTLRPRQIISGKLASAVVQMIVFFSAITPCLAFTYLLRGVDAPTIALLLAYTFFASFALSMLGLLLATLSRQRYGQLVLSVGFVALLLVRLQSGPEIGRRIGASRAIELYVAPEFWIMQSVRGRVLRRRPGAGLPGRRGDDHLRHGKPLDAAADRDARSAGGARRLAGLRLDRHRLRLDRSVAGPRHRERRATGS